MSVFMIFFVVVLVVGLVWAVNGGMLQLPAPIKLVFNILVLLLVVYVILSLVGVAPALHR